MADVGVSLFFLFDKDSCVFQPVSFSGLLHGVNEVITLTVP